jgi:hypothetical protein
MPDTLFDAYPGLLYHSVSDPECVRIMIRVRGAYIALAATVLELVPAGRSRSLAMTHLEDSLMRAIQALALEGGTPVFPDRDEEMSDANLATP